MSVESISLNIAIGVISSVIGALFVFAGQYGIRIRKKAVEKNVFVKKKEEQQWKTNDFGIRQGITNKYLFIILRYLFLANMFWLVPEFLVKIYMLSDAFFNIYPYEEISYTIGILLRLSSLVLFFLGLGNILRYMKLRQSDDN